MGTYTSKKRLWRRNSVIRSSLIRELLVLVVPLGLGGHPLRPERLYADVPSSDIRVNEVPLRGVEPQSPIPKDWLGICPFKDPINSWVQTPELNRETQALGLERLPITPVWSDVVHTTEPVPPIWIWGTRCPALFLPANSLEFVIIAALQLPRRLFPVQKARTSNAVPWIVRSPAAPS